jgi:hypothetical protein
MTLEELKERHEALTQSVELLRDRTTDIFTAIDRLGEKVDRIADETKRDGEHIRALARIAEIHERRLTDLEGQ